MKRIYGRHHPAALVQRVLVLCALCIATAISLKAQTGPSTVLFVGHLNTDCYPDTVRGHEIGARTYLPDLIVWGKPMPERPTPCEKDVPPDGHPQSVRRFPATPIAYPHWPELSGSVAFEQFNTNDNITDMILYLWGKSPLTGKDTSRTVVVYGQIALDTLPVLMLAEVARGVQTAPFFATDLTVGREFINPAVRDIGGAVSYELPRVNFAVQNEKPVKIGSPALPGTNATVTAYPNPAELWTRLESSPLEAGEYTITVLAVNGRVYHTQTVEVSQQGQISRELNLNELPSGYYVVRLHCAGIYISSYPIVVVH